LLEIDTLFEVAQILRTSQGEIESNGGGMNVARIDREGKNAYLYNLFLKPDCDIKSFGELFSVYENPETPLYVKKRIEFDLGDLNGSAKFDLKDGLKFFVDTDKRNILTTDLDSNPSMVIGGVSAKSMGKYNQDWQWRGLDWSSYKSRSKRTEKGNYVFEFANNHPGIKDKFGCLHDLVVGIVISIYAQEGIERIVGDFYDKDKAGVIDKRDGSFWVSETRKFISPYVRLAREGEDLSRANLECLRAA